mgnify:CR=1 FL=1
MVGTVADAEQRADGPAGAVVLIVKYDLSTPTISGSLTLSTADADVAYSARAAPTGVQMVFTMTTTAAALPYVGSNSGDAGSKRSSMRPRRGCVTVRHTPLKRPSLTPSAMARATLP